MFDVNTAHTLARWQHQERQLQQQLTHERPWGLPGRTSTEREFEDLNLWSRQAADQARVQRRATTWSRMLPLSSGNGSLHTVIAQLKQRLRPAH